MCSDKEGGKEAGGFTAVETVLGCHRSVGQFLYRPGVYSRS